MGIQRGQITNGQSSPEPVALVRDPYSHQDGGVVVGVDIGGTKTLIVAMDLATGREVARERHKTPADTNVDAQLEMLIEHIREVTQDADCQPNDLRAVGFAVPGRVTFASGRVLTAGNLNGWNDLPLRDRMARSLGVPVFVDQDANAAALGERWRGGARQMTNFVFLALGTGVGVGSVIGGRIHRGHTGGAGEAGNMLTSIKQLGEDGGKHGALDMRVGNYNIRQITEELIGEPLSVKQVLSQTADDKRLAKLARQIIDHLAVAIINISVLLDPEAIILGGGTGAAGDALIGPLRDRVARDLPICPALMMSVLGEDAQVHGAAYGAMWALDPDLANRHHLRFT